MLKRIGKQKLLSSKILSYVNTTPLYRTPWSLSIRIFKKSSWKNVEEIEGDRQHKNKKKIPFWIDVNCYFRSKNEDENHFFPKLWNSFVFVLVFNKCMFASLICFLKKWNNFLLYNLDTKRNSYAVNFLTWNNNWGAKWCALTPYSFNFFFKVEDFLLWR